MEPDKLYVQSEFFNQIRAGLPAHINLVDAVADFLNISNDSAYRRIRGETPVSFDEIGKLSRHFKISVDKLLNLNTDSYIFSGSLADAQDHLLDKWLETYWFLFLIARKYLQYRTILQN